MSLFLETVKSAGQTAGGLGENNTDELLRDVEGQLALGIGDLRANDGGGILRGPQAMLAFFAAFKKVADTGIELGAVVQIIVVEVARIEDGEKLRVPSQHRVGAKVGGDLHGLALQNRGAQRQQRVIVLKRKAQGFIKGDARRRLG